MNNFETSTKIETLQTYLIEYFRKELSMPSYEEIMKFLGVTSKNSVFKKMYILELTGIIEKHGGKFRLNPLRFTIKLHDNQKIIDKEEEKDFEKWEKKKQSYNN